MAQNSRAQKKISPARIAGGVFFLLLAIAAIGSSVLVFFLFVYKQNSLPWMITTASLFIMGLVFLVVGIVFFMPAPLAAGHDELNHCPKCGCNLRQRHPTNARCPNSRCDKMLGPEDFDAHFCTKCGTNVLQTIGQITGQFPAMPKSSIPPQQPNTQSSPRQP